MTPKTYYPEGRKNRWFMFEAHETKAWNTLKKTKQKTKNKTETKIHFDAIRTEMVEMTKENEDVMADDEDDAEYGDEADEE